MQRVLHRTGAARAPFHTLLHLPKEPEFVTTLADNFSERRATLDVLIGDAAISHLRFDGPPSQLTRGDVLTQNGVPVATVVAVATDCSTAFASPLAEAGDGPAMPMPAGVRLAVGDLVELPRSTHVVTHASTETFELSPRLPGGAAEHWTLKRRTNLPNTNYRPGHGDLRVDGALCETRAPHHVFEGDLVVLALGGQPALFAVSNVRSPTAFEIDGRAEPTGVTEWFVAARRADASAVVHAPIDPDAPVALRELDFYEQRVRDAPVELGRVLGCSSAAGDAALPLTLRPLARQTPILPALPLGFEAIVAVSRPNGDDADVACYGTVGALPQGSFHLV